MPSQRDVEADAVALAFQAALTRIGAHSVAEALILWQTLPAQSQQSTAQAWLAQAVQLVMSGRRDAQALARAYYRLARALYTGKTIPDPLDLSEPTSISLSDLRSQFDSLAFQSAPVASQGSTPPSPTRTPQEGGSGRRGPVDVPLEDQAARDQEAKEERILIEEIRQLKAEQQAEAEAEARAEAEEALTNLGADNQTKKNRKLDTSLPASEIDKQRDQIHQDVGNRQASSIERMTLNGARNELWSLSGRDKRVIGYVRLSRTGTPCGWCAMLISRGPVYRSESTASFKGGAAVYADGNTYHDNCHCYAMPVFGVQQYDNSELFDLNRKYAEEWPRVTRGLSGKAALSAWRYFIRQEQKNLHGQAS